MPNRRHKHTDLFLVRVWAQDDQGSGSDSDSVPTVRYRGSVQRVVSGEARQFDSWQALLDVLNAMLLPADGAGGTTSNPQPDPGRQRS